MHGWKAKQPEMGWKLALETLQKEKLEISINRLVVISD